MWETDETRPYNFNDADKNPQNDQEGVSQRHAGGNPLTPFAMWAAVQSWDGSAPAADFVKWKLFTTLRIQGGPRRPNELLCGPGLPLRAAMRFLNQCILGAVVMLPVFVGCSKKATESPAPAAVSESTMPTQGTQPVQGGECAASAAGQCELGTGAVSEGYCSSEL